VGDKEEDDVVEKIKDITFLIKPEVIDEFGAMTILSSEENDGMGLSLRPLIESEGGCGGGCSGCN
jgi:hypothetical protein